MRDAGWRSREVWIAAAVTMAVLLIQWSMARHVSFCGTPDSCAYLALGESLSRHQGFHQNFLFQYQFVSPHLPTHGIDYWRPGTSFLLLLAQPFGGVTLHSSIAITMVAGVVLALAAWRIAMDFSGNRHFACASYLLCLVLPPLWDGGLTPDSALYYGAFVAWFLALLRVRSESYRKDLAALACVSAVSLIRNDAILLLVPLISVLWMRHRKQPRGSGLRYSALMLAGFVAANLPIALINQRVLGHAFPPGTGGAIYLTDLAELTAYGAPATMHTMFAHGILALLNLRLMVLPQLLYRLVWVVIGFGAIFVLLIGFQAVAVRRRILPELTGGISFLTTLILGYGVVLPAVGGFAALRSCCGLLPLIAALMVAGIARLGASANLRRGLFAGVFAFYVGSGMTANRRGVEELNRSGDAMRRVAKALKGEGVEPGRGAAVMIADAAQFSETTGYSAIPLPSNGWRGLKAAVADLRPSCVVMSETAYQGLHGQLDNLAAERPASLNIVILRIKGTKTGT